MCGIVGICHLNGRPIAPDVLKKMTDIISFRGPDDEGHYIDGTVGFGHRRLSILDLSKAGHQPMLSPDENTVVTYNGEIYNFRELRAELESMGRTFRSRSDTEVLLHAYEVWGQNCLSRFNGMFAFAIWDRKKHQLFCARDRYGIKPFYWYFQDGVFLFSSEIKAILEYPHVKRAVCLTALNEYFTFQNIFSESTLFEGIRLLPAGNSLTLNLNSSSPPTIHRYWDFPCFDDPLNLSESDASERLFELFSQAVKRQLVSDVPVGAYLSGGIDSASVVAVARKNLGRLFTFTGGFDLSSASGMELSFDERGASEYLSNLFKTEHYEMVMHSGDMEHVMPELIWHLEDLRVGQCYPNYYVARLAGKFVKVVVSGAGGDELFGGYPWRYFRGINSSSPEAYFKNYYSFWQRLVPEEEKNKLFNNDVSRSLIGHSTFDVFKNVFGNSAPPLKTNADFMNASLYFEQKTFLHGLLLVEDKLSMAHSLETRVPFLDNDLVDFSCRLPPNHKLQNFDQLSLQVDEDDILRYRDKERRFGGGKAVLRQAMRRLIPMEITNRAKQGFSAPDASWFRGESIDYVNTLLRDPKGRIFDYLQPAYVNKVLDEHASGQVNHRLLIWSLISFEWWLRKFMVN